MESESGVHSKFLLNRFCYWATIKAHVIYAKKELPKELLLRYLADSNRRTWFCRPLTKPLIQGTECFLR